MKQRLEPFWKIMGSKILLICSLSFLLLYCFFAYPEGSAQLREITPPGGEFDLIPFYSPASVYSKIGLYSAEARQAFIRLHLNFDLWFPLAYGLAFFFGISFLLRRAGKMGLWYEPLLPLAAMAADYGENFSLILLFSRHPEQVPVLPVLAAFSTGLKWICITVSLFFIIGNIIIIVKRRFL